MAQNEKLVITEAEVRIAIRVDPDYPESEVLRLARSASSFIKQKSGYDFAQDETIEPLALECATLYVRQLFFESVKEYDYTIGIGSLIEDLKDIAAARKVG